MFDIPIFYFFFYFSLYCLAELRIGLKSYQELKYKWREIDWLALYTLLCVEQAIILQWLSSMSLDSSWRDISPSSAHVEVEAMVVLSWPILLSSSSFFLFFFLLLLLICKLVFCLFFFQVQFKFGLSDSIQITFKFTKLEGKWVRKGKFRTFLQVACLKCILIVKFGLS